MPDPEVQVAAAYLASHSVLLLGLGIVTAIGALAAIVAAVRTLAGPLLAAGSIAAQAGGGLLNLALKETFERTRPEFADPLLGSSSWSFPSGHALRPSR